MMRRWLNAWLGTGPWRMAPLAAIAAQREPGGAAVHRPENALRVLAIRPGEPVAYRMGRSLLGQEVRFEQLGPDPRYRAELVTGLPPQHLYALNRAGVIGAGGIVYCRISRCAVTETVRCWTSSSRRHPVFRAVRHPPPTPLPGVTLNLGTLGGNGFYHFLIEALPRLALAQAWLGHVDHVLANGFAGGFQEQWLTDAGVPVSKIRWLGGLAHFSCDTLLFADQPMPDQQPGRSMVESLRSLFPVKSAAGRRRLWISRGDAPTRRLAWEKELVARLPGFESVELARLRAAQQRELVAAADVIAGPHGAGLSHIVFSRPGTRVIELFPESDPMFPLYGRLAAVSGASHAWARTDFQNSAGAAALASAINDFAHHD